MLASDVCYTKEENAFILAWHAGTIFWWLFMPKKIFAVQQLSVFVRMSGMQGPASLSYTDK